MEKSLATLANNTNSNHHEVIRPHQLLGIAVVKQAADDYAYCLCKDHFMTKPYSKTASGVIISTKELENFFFGEGFKLFSKADPHYICEKIRKLVKEANYVYTDYLNLVKPHDYGYIFVHNGEQAHKLAELIAEHTRNNIDPAYHRVVVRRGCRHSVSNPLPDRWDVLIYAGMKGKYLFKVSVMPFNTNVRVTSAIPSFDILRHEYRMGKDKVEDLAITRGSLMLIGALNARGGDEE